MANLPGIEHVPSVVPAWEEAVATPDAARASSRIENLVAAAARALAADGAAFIVTSPNGVTASVREGLMVDLDLSESLTRAALEKSPLVIERSFAADELSYSLYEAGIRFFASARVGSAAAPEGYLAIVGPHSRTLSGSQKFVLQTFASEIADRLAFDAQRALAAAAHATDLARDGRLRMLESAVARSNDAVLITEAEPNGRPGPCIFANDAFTRMTGFELHEIIGESPRILQGPDTDQSARARLTEAFRQWQPVEVELLNYRKDKTPFWAELSIVPVADETGHFTHWVSIQRDVTERKAAQESATPVRGNEAPIAALDHRTFHDELTGLRNRAYVNDRVRTLLGRLRGGTGERFALLFFDLDRFKVVNDSLGHRVGDQLLIELARRIGACIRSYDTLGRMGGDEFTCIIEADHLTDVVSVANRILGVLRAPIRLAGREIFASTSIGIAYVDARYENAAEIFRDADTAMYGAKRKGGMRYEIFHETMHESALAALRIQMDLRGAVDRREFVLHYQPLVAREDGIVCGLEALVRWEHPQYGLIQPADFIPIAEETGLIVPLGTWVLHESCKRMRAWHDASPGRPKLTLAVNVSSRQLYDPRYFMELESALVHSGLDPRTLQLEITESVFLQHVDDFWRLLERIRALGVRIALDDFGTGYSSLSYLERFRLDTLKIDRSFVAKIGARPTSEIVRLIVGLAGALGMDVVAEGIENADQWETLRSLGCSRAQGYYFSRPVPEGDVAALLARPLGAETVSASDT